MAPRPKKLLPTNTHPNVYIPRTGRRGGVIVPHIMINLNITIDQYNWLKKESTRRGKAKGGSPQYISEIIREGIEYLRTKDSMIFEAGGLL